MGLRGEGNETRRKRLAKLKAGPGYFVYKGGFFHVNTIPTPRLYGRKTAMFDAAGMPIVDASGRQQYQRAGAIVYDLSGRPVMGGKPKVEKTELDAYTLRGVTFARGEPVYVSDEDMARKCRCLSILEEVEPVEIVEQDESPAADVGEASRAAPVEAPAVAPKRRGRPPKAAAKQEG